MIYTVTFNPSLDYMVSVPDFQLGKTNRTRSEELIAGGKGINVSIVLQHLGIESVILGFTAGFTGAQIVKQLQAMGLKSDFIMLPRGISRINVKLKESDGTEINAAGPEIDQDSLEKLWTQLHNLKAGDCLVLAGSVPNNLSETIYRDIVKELSVRGVLCIVDAARGLLRQVLPYHPFLIKPNLQELQELFGVSDIARKDCLYFMKQLQAIGARNVMVSMGGDGAVLLTEDGTFLQLSAPDGILVNAVGAGDSMIAGFLAGWMEKKEYVHAFRMAVAAGSASAFSEGLAGADLIYEIEKTKIRQ